MVRLSAIKVQLELELYFGIFKVTILIADTTIKKGLTGPLVLFENHFYLI